MGRKRDAFGTHLPASTVPTPAQGHAKPVKSQADEESAFLAQTDIPARMESRLPDYNSIRNDAIEDGMTSIPGLV